MRKREEKNIYYRRNSRILINRIELINQLVKNIRKNTIDITNLAYY